MRRAIALSLLTAALATPVFAESRQVAGFSEVQAFDRLEVEVNMGERFAVEVVGSDADRVRTRVEGDELVISDARRPWFGDGPDLDALVRVTMPRVRGVASARGAELRATLSGPCGDLAAVAAMGGSTRVDGLQCDSVDASAAMGGELRLAGACRVLDVAAAMGGVVNARDLQCEFVDASATMGGDVRAFASRSYDATAAMGGAVNVAGAGRRADTSAVMGGSVSSSN